MNENNVQFRPVIMGTDAGDTREIPISKLNCVRT